MKTVEVATEPKTVTLEVLTDVLDKTHFDFIYQTAKKAAEEGKSIIFFKRIERKKGASEILEWPFRPLPNENRLKEKLAKVGIRLDFKQFQGIILRAFIE